jgi:hypothetical protein
MQCTCVLAFTNAQPSDAGVYDVVVTGNNWFVGAKTTVSIQIPSGPSQLSWPRLDGAWFLSDLQAPAGRSYVIEYSTNLTDWTSLLTLTNSTGVVTFSNALGSAATGFYRAKPAN